MVISQTSSWLGLWIAPVFGSISFCSLSFTDVVSSWYDAVSAWGWAGGWSWAVLVHSYLCLIGGAYHRRLGGVSNREILVVPGCVISWLGFFSWLVLRGPASACPCGLVRLTLFCEMDQKVVLWDPGWSLVVPGWVLVSINKISFDFERILGFRWFPWCLGTPGASGPAGVRFPCVLRGF